MILNTPKILSGVSVLIILFLVVLVYVPVNVGNNKSEFIIEEGSGAVRVARRLKDEKLIRSKFIFLAYAKITGNERNLKSGRYKISEPLNIPKLVDKFSKGLSEEDSVTAVIPEGFNAWEITRRLADLGIIEASKTEEFLTLALESEGYLFPDTYRFYKKEEPQVIIEKMKANFYEKPQNISEQILIMASILEKEVKTEEDMRTVAGILYKRMSVGMFLQVDASVAYGVCMQQGEVFCDISKIPLRDFLHVQGDYNTYTRQGLPKGPISNPGLQAINAALNPVSSDYWFYLSVTADDGRTIFSKTLEEHNANRIKYLK